VLFCLCLPGVGRAQSSADDRGFLQGLLEDALSAPGRSVQITGFSGALSSRAEVQAITVTDPEGVWLRAEDVALVWNRAALLSGRIEIDEISIGQLDLPRLPLPEPGADALPSPEAQGRFALPDLPVSVDIAQMAIRRAQIGAPVLGEPFEAGFEGALALESGAGRVALSLTRLDRPGAVQLNGAFDNASRALVLDLSLREAQGGLASTLLNLPGAPALTLEVQGSDPIDDFTGALRLASAGQDRITGQITLKTTAEGLGFAADLGGDLASLVAPDLAPVLGPRVALRARGVQGEGALRLQEIDLSGADYGLRGAVALLELGSDAGPRILPDLTLSAQDLTRFAPLVGLDLSGAADLTLQGQIEPLSGRGALTLSGGTQDLQSGVAQLDGLLRGQGDLSLHVTRDETGLRAAPLRIETAKARITGSADLKTGASLADLTILLPDLSVALPELPGAAELRAKLQQQGTVWQMTLDTALPGEATLRWRGSLRDNRHLEGQLSGRIGRLASFARLTGQPLSGQMDLTSDLRADLVEQSLDMRAEGAGFALKLGLPTLDTYLRGTTRFSTALTRSGAGALDISALDLTGSGLRAALSGRLDPASQSADLRYSLDIDDLARALPELPGAARLRGTAQQRGTLWQLSADASGPGGLAAQLGGSVNPTGPVLDLAITGDAPLALINRHLNGQALSGDLQFDLNARGAPALAALSGVLRLSGARLSVPAQNITLERMSGDITLGAGRATLDLQGRVDSGGPLQLRGPVALSAPFESALVLKLRDASLRDPSLFETDLRADLTLTGPLQGGARIGGDITLERVELGLPALGPSYSALEGLRHLNPPAKVQRTLRFAGLDQPAEAGAPVPDFPLDLTVSAPGRIFVRGRGLDAELGGALQLSGSTNAVEPSGQFDLIRGRLDLLGRRLTLTEGAVQLRGSFDPVIRFVAATQVDGFDLQLAIAGFASAPELTVSAIPELPQDEALSLFLFGRDITQISGLQALQLAAAVRTLSGGGRGGLSETLRQGLGVDELDFATGEDGATQARIGKYISDEVYTDVTVESGGAAQINLNIDLSDSVTLRGRVDNQGDTGIGVFFERDY
jgi:translocation and assembly module TamB